MLVLIWVQTVRHYRIVFLNNFFEMVNFERKKSADNKKAELSDSSLGDILRE